MFNEFEKFMRTSKFRWLMVIIAFLVFLIVYIGSSMNDKSDAATFRGGNNCVDGYEWSHMQDQLGDENHSARRAVVESTWDVRHVGAFNQYWVPGNGDKFYSAAYRWCGDPGLKIVVVYRTASDAWQYAMKGEFVGTP